jgi:hypothetical protein
VSTLLLSTRVLPGMKNCFARSFFRCQRLAQYFACPMRSRRILLLCLLGDFVSIFLASIIFCHCWEQSERFGSESFAMHVIWIEVMDFHFPQKKNVQKMSYQFQL